MSRHATDYGKQLLRLVSHGLADEVTGEELRVLDEAGWITYGLGGYRLTPAGTRASVTIVRVIEPGE